VKKQVLNLSFFDYSGAGERYSQAINRIGRYNCSSLKIFPHKYGYKSDYIVATKGLHLQSEEYTKRLSHAQNLIDQADIIHLQGDDSILHWNSKEKFKNAYPGRAYPGLVVPVDKPVVITTIGSFFRRHVDPCAPGGISRSRDSLEVVAAHTNARTVDTPDLNYPEFDAQWLPFTLDTKSVKNRWLSGDHSIPLIGHSPSLRSRKGTDSIFLPALEILKARGIKFELDIIENTSYLDSLKRKKNLSFFFDQCGIGWYGCSLTEATQYGIPSMAWLSDHSLNQMKPEDRDVPVVSYVPTAQGCADAIINILESDMEALSRKTKEWTDAVHSYEAVGTKLSNIYDGVL
jgi:hypothetical protein